MQEGSEMAMRAQRPLAEDGEERGRDAAGSEPAGIGLDETPDRRRFVRHLALGGAAVAAGAVLAPVVGATSASAQTTTTVATAPTVPAADVTMLNYAISLELAAAQLYTDIVATGKLTGDALADARQYIAHHTDHATTFGTLAANQAVNTANAKLLAQIGPQITAAPDAPALYQIAFDLESSMASTHQQLMGTVTNWQSAGTVASVEPIEAQHAVVWGQLLKLPTSAWMPAFESVSGSFDPAQFATS
jgi:Ferritin-like domain